MYPPVVCITPLGCPVDPEVYKINRGSSASISSGGHISEIELSLVSSSHQKSLPDIIFVSSPVRLTTIHFSTLVSSIAVSALDFEGTDFPPLTPLSAHIRSFGLQSKILLLSESELNPPNTTE